MILKLGCESDQSCSLSCEAYLGPPNAVSGKHSSPVIFLGIRCALCPFASGEGVAGTCNNIKGIMHSQSAFMQFQCTASRERCSTTNIDREVCCPYNDAGPAMNSPNILRSSLEWPELLGHVFSALDDEYRSSTFLLVSCTVQWQV